MLLTHTAARAGRLLTFLRRELCLSSSLVKRLKWRGAFFVDGQPVHTDFPVLPGQVVTVLLDEDLPEFPPEDGPLDILYEDDALLAVDKPAGLLMHPSFYRDMGTLANGSWATIAGRASPAPSTPSAAWTGTPSGWSCWRKTPTSTLGWYRLSPRAGSTRPTRPWSSARLPPMRAGGVFPSPAGAAEACCGKSERTDKPPRPGIGSCGGLTGTVICNWSRSPADPPAAGPLRPHGCPILGDPQYGSEASQALSQQMACPASSSARSDWSSPTP